MYNVFKKRNITNQNISASRAIRSPHGHWTNTLYNSLLFTVYIQCSCKVFKWINKKYSQGFKCSLWNLAMRQSKSTSVYIKNYCIEVSPRRCLRSSSHRRLVISQPSKTVLFGERFFAVGGPSLWNLLPDNVKEAGSIELFKQRLKTHLFI